MKKVTTKEAISLAGIVIVSPVFALAILISARTAAVVQSDVSLLGLVLCGAVISGLNGFGRRAAKTQSGFGHSGSPKQSLVRQS